MSYRPLTLWLTILAVRSADAQLEAIRTRTDTGWVTTHYFLTGEVSATEWHTPANKRNGFICFAKDGSTLWNKTFSEAAASWPLRARYHRNGALNSVHLTEPTADPDRSIHHNWFWQWDGAFLTNTTDTTERQPATAVGRQAAHMPMALPGMDPSPPPPATPPMYASELILVRGKAKVDHVSMQNFDENGKLQITRWEFGWLDTLRFGSMISLTTFPEVSDFGLISAMTNEKEIKKRRPAPVKFTVQQDLSPYYRRYILRIGD